MRHEMSRPARASRVREIGVDLALLLGALLLLYRPLLEPGTSPPAAGFTDLRLLAQPACLFSARSLLEGSFPFWNPYWFAGFPHFAMPESGLLYPANLLCGWVAFPVFVDVDLLAHLFLLAAFGYLLGRDLFGARLPALALGFLLLAGVTSTGPLVGGHLWTTHAVAWFPLALLLLRRTLMTASVLPALGFAAVLALQVFAGAPQVVTYQLLVCATVVAFDLVGRSAAGRETWRALVARAGLALAAVALGLTLAAVQLLPSQELLAHSARGGGVAPGYFYGGLGLRAGVFLDELLLRRGSFAFLPGALTLALAAVGLAMGRGRDRFAFLGAGLVCAAYMLLPPWLYESVVRHLPGLGATRFNTRISWFLDFNAYVLAAYGVAALARHGARAPWLWAAGLTLGFAVAPWIEQPDRRTVLASIGLGSAAAGLLVWRRPDARGFALAGLAALLIWEGSTFQHANARYGAALQLGVDPAFAAFSETRSDRGRIALFKRRGLLSRLHQNLGAITGDRVVGGYHGLLLADYADFFEEVAGVPLVTRSPDGRLLWRTNVQGRDWITEQSLRALDVLNVRYLVSEGLELAVPEAHLAPQGPGETTEGRRGFRKRRLQTLIVYENLDVLPPAYLVHRVERVASGREARLRLAEADFEPRRAAIVTGEGNIDHLGDPGGAEERVDVRAYGPNRVELDVDAAAAGILVLGEVDYPGWRVFVDGVAQRTLRVNALFRGARVEAGRHRVRFEYRPSRLALGATISAVAGLALVAGLLRELRRRRLRPPG